ncbi:MAG TPA: M43 family zinc metalloprotease [Bacteroidia bacterium]|jgi:PKD repeat protein
MKNNLYKLILGLVLGTSVSAYGQFKCGTTEAMRKLVEKHPELAGALNAETPDLSGFQMRSPNYDSTTLYIVPVVFHVLHTNGSENISDAQIFDQIAILNEDFRKMNADTATVDSAFYDNMADSRIEFRLAQLDPNGNCTNGIDRIYSRLTNNADDNSKLNQWPRDKYLNVWVVNTMASVGTAGYAYYPSATASPLFPYDGIIILNDYIGSIGTGATGRSRALTHEIGHYLNLPHTWGSTNEPGVACGDDGVGDTPMTKGHTACSAVDKYAHACEFYPISNAARYTFNDVTTGSGTVDPTPNDTTNSISLLPFTAVNVSSNPTANGRFEFSNWGTGATNGATTYASMTGALSTTKYYEFSISPRSVDTSMTITGISFVVNRSATGPRTWAIRSSLNNFTTNITPTISPANTNLMIPASTTVWMMKFDSTQSQIGCKVTLPSNTYTTVSPIRFRIYAFNAEDALGSFGIDSVQVIGTFGVVENTENFMDYSYCSKMYTRGQKERMRTALSSTIANRANLWSASNHAFTGILNPQNCVPLPEFSYNKIRICAGNSVVFTKNIQRGTPDSLRWRFQGGVPATSTSMANNITVNYPNPGLYTVSLTAYNSAGTDSVVKTDIIRVDGNWADINTGGSFLEDFQNTSDFYWKWQVHDIDNNGKTWYVSNVGYNSTKAVVMTAHDNYANDVDELLSPSFNLDYTSGNVMTFRCAAASAGLTGAEVNDKLDLYVTSNCGVNWTLLKSFHDSTLINNGYHPNYFTPTSPTQWAFRSVPIPALYATGNTRFKFQYTTGAASNSIYLDDINITGVVGIDENNDAVASMSVYPNPTSQAATVAYQLSSKADTRIEVMDVLGKVIFSQVNKNQADGNYSVTISKQNLELRNGIYFVKLTVNDKSATKKLIVTQ